MPDLDFASLPFEEAILYFRRKVVLPTNGWRDVLREAQDRAFVVAGATKMSLLEDLRQAVDQAITDGTTLADFRKEFDQAVQAAGWSYKGSRGWRTRVIYQTNLRVAHAAGRYQQMKSEPVASRRPYWQYRHGGSAEPRVMHSRSSALGGWNGLVLNGDDPWWDSHYPPNGWGCSCFVRTLSTADLDRLELRPGSPPEASPMEAVDRETGEITETPAGIGFGWDYAPGRASLRALAPREDGSVQLAWSEAPVPESRAFGNGRPSPPTPRQTSTKDLLPEDVTEEEALAAFFSELGTGPDGTVTDPIGESFVVGGDLFRDASGRSKAVKRGRGQFVRLLARAILDPDEIWTQIETDARLPGGQRLFRYYLARFAVEGSTVPLSVIYAVSRDRWTGVTAFPAERPNQLEKRRSGVRLYRRES